MADDELLEKIDKLKFEQDDNKFGDFQDTITDTNVNEPSSGEGQSDETLAKLTEDNLGIECPEEKEKVPDEKVPDRSCTDTDRIPDNSGSDTEKIPVSSSTDTDKVPISSGTDTDKTEHESVETNTALVYDKRMSKYRFRGNHPERPERILFIYRKLEDFGLTKRCHLVEPRLATKEELLTKHTLKHINVIESIKDMNFDELEKLACDYDSIYFHTATTESAFLSAGCTVALMEEILMGKFVNGAAIVRPPGHHALNHCSMGFCHFNNVAIAAMVAIEKYNLKRILIVDWDVHYGNGTHKMFEDDPRVLLFSMHRYDHGYFWPCLEEANYDAVGVGEGEGYNIHVAWNDGRMGDAEYLFAFEKVLLPVAEEYNPELVIVSSGFDSGDGDPLGGFCVTPAGYANMTHKLMKLANGKVFLVLEGGYNLHTISESMAACVLTLLNDTAPKMKSNEPMSSGVECVDNTFLTMQKYWSSLRS